MKKMDDYMKDTIRAWLSHDTPRTQKELEELTGIDRRYIKQAIRDLRFDGLPICSGNKGYWIARNEEELNRTKARLWHEISERLVLANAMDMRPLEGQMVMEEVQA